MTGQAKTEQRAPTALRQLPLLALLISITACATGTPMSSVEQQLQYKLNNLKSKHHFPGATLAVIHNGTRFTLTTGLADRENLLLMRQDSRMMSGSTGKTFVAAIILQLVAEGRLNLDEPIANKLGAAPWLLPLANASKITPRQLLGHRSGLADHIYTQAYAKASAERLGKGPDEYLQPEELVALLHHEPAKFEPGFDFAYTDTGYIVLGLLIEAVTGKRYEDALQERLLTPLKLSQTTPARGRAHWGLASGYTSPDNPFGLPVKTAASELLVFNPASEWTGGGLVTHPMDLATWIRALITSDLIASPLREDMQRDAEDDGYGLGIAVWNNELGQQYGHNGWFPGYVSKVIHLADHNVTIAMQVNSDHKQDISRYTHQLAKLLVDDNQASRPAGSDQ